MSENPLFSIFSRVKFVTTSHEALTTSERAEWLRWIVAERSAFLATHPQHGDAHGGVCAGSHGVFVDFVTARYPGKVRG